MLQEYFNKKLSGTKNKKEYKKRIWQEVCSCHLFSGCFWLD